MESSEYDSEDDEEDESNVADQMDRIAEINAQIERNRNN